MFPQPKPLKGTHVLDRERERYQFIQLERLAKAAAKRRDGWGCRWPETHRCRGLVEVAHIFHDKGMGGDHGTVSETWNLMALCSWIHRRGPQSIHSKDLRVEPETPLGADAACSFWRRDEHDVWICVGVEIRIGVLRKV